MMRKLRIYLDTTIINFVIADDAPHFQAMTIEFFEKYLHDYDVFISDVLLMEIDRTTNQKRKQQLLDIVKQYPFNVLRVLRDEAVLSLAQKYMKENIIPADEEEDALHIAVATLFEMDILLSWNFKHLANIKKQILVNAINEREGYVRTLNLLNPMEVLYEKR